LRCSTSPDFIPQFNASFRVQDKFDPYSEWLSIPADRRPPDYYQLLGLAPLESDLFRIIASADRQIGRVLPFVAGEHATAARRLLDELLTAKGFLITPAAKALYDAEFRQRLAQSGSPEDAALLDMLGSAPPPETSRPQRAPPTATRRAAPPPAAPPPAAPPPAAPPPAAPPPAAPPPAATPPTCKAEASPIIKAPDPPPVANEGVARAKLVAAPGAAFGSEAPALGAIGVTVATAAPPSAPGDAGGESPAQLESARAPEMDENVDAPRFDSRRLARNYERRSAWAAPALAFVVALSTVGIAAGVAWRQGFRLQLVAANSGQIFPQDPAPARDETLPRDDIASRTSVPTRTGNMSPPPAPSIQPTARETTLGPATSVSASTHENTTAEGQKPPPEAMPPRANPRRPAGTTERESAVAAIDPRKPAPLDAKQVSKLKEALALARAALASRDLAAADKQLAAADAQATSPELVARVAAARLVRDYVDGFWKAVRESAKTLKGGEEFTVQGKIIAIVDASPDRIVLRAAGQNREFKLNEVPPHMATALAERWLDKNDANSKVFVGAFWLVDPKIEPGLAREKLAEAAGATDAAAIARLLDAPW
jgi:hypothetical protein